MAFGFRRVVTGDRDGKAVILSDTVPEVTVRARTGGRAQQMWYTEKTPEPFTGTDLTGKITGTNPPLTGSIFRILEIPSEDSYPKRTEADGEEHRRNTGVEVGPLGKGRHPAMHRTRSIDYALILDGEIDMLLDDTEVHCKAGDVMIQNGTNHAWVNRSGKPCTIAFILIGAEVPWK